MFAIISYWWCCLVAVTVSHLGKEKVTPKMKDLEHSNFVHAFTHLRVLTVGIFLYLLLDVQHPPPALFLCSPSQYTARVRHAGGIVLLMYLKFAGSPTLWWQRAARAARADRAAELHAYAFHVNRAGAFKPNCVVVSIIFMLSIVATHPKISAVVRAFLSISLLGKIGSNQWCDRLLEYVNFLQQKRMNAFAAFDTALHNSELIPAMLHVDHAFEEAMHGCGPTEEPMTKSMLREANMLRLFFKGLAGTDLTISEDKNPFWHTGNPVPNVDTERERTPWIHWKRVAYAFSKGVGRETREKWDDFIMSWLRRCCFKM